MGMSRAEILGLFPEVEPRVQASETFVKYRRVLWRVMELMGSELGHTISVSRSWGVWRIPCPTGRCFRIRSARLRH